MDWKECISKRIAKDVKKDEFFIKSLIKSSRKNLINFVDGLMK